jgi:uncharacterized membrane protein YgaE (UPF0421/DUF939 family)
VPGSRPLPGRRNAIHLPADIRRIVQTAVAAAAAVAAGAAVSERRVYWALIAVLVIFIGANNSREQVGKALQRATGTLAGVGVGSLLAPVTGPHAGWAIAVVLGAFFFGFYFLQINYTFFVAGLTVAIAQLYAQMGELGNGLLLLRLAETSIGALAAIVAVLVVLPVRTHRAFRLAMRDHLAACSSLVGQAVSQLGHDESALVQLHRDVRAFDQAHHSLLATAAPLRWHLFARASWRVGEAIRLAEDYRDYARSLVSDLASADRVGPGARAGLVEAGRVLGTSIEALRRALDGQPGSPYRPSAARFELIERQLETAAGALHDGQLAVRDLRLIDEIMAEFAAHEAIEIVESRPADRARRPVSHRLLDPCRRRPTALRGHRPLRVSHQGALRATRSQDAVAHLASAAGPRAKSETASTMRVSACSGLARPEVTSTAMPCKTATRSSRSRSGFPGGRAPACCP